MSDGVLEGGQQYDAEYYAHHLGLPYRRGEAGWDEFFGRIADEIVARLNPATVLDVGCAIGFLVEKLRDRDVDARGIDISEYALSQAPTQLQPYLRPGSVTEELEGPYDLVVCIEVVEHLPESAAAAAVANLAAAGDAILFSSSPSDFAEPTHQNVRPIDYWLKLFAVHGFTRAAGFDATVVAPHAMLLRRQANGVPGVVLEYERWHTEQLERLAEKFERADRRAKGLEHDLRPLQRERDGRGRQGPARTGVGRLVHLRVLARRSLESLRDEGARGFTLRALRWFRRGGGAERR